MVLFYRADESINCRWAHSRNTYHVELHVHTLLLLLLHRVIIPGLRTQRYPSSFVALAQCLGGDGREEGFRCVHDDPLVIV